MEPRAELAAFFGYDHRGVDGDWAKVEAAVETDDIEKIRAAWIAFSTHQRRHLQMEDEIMFPALETATGMTGGPTAVMRAEHEQMRGLMDQMDSVLTAGDAQEMVDLGDTLLMLIQQHNQKEEGILYPMASQVLSAGWEKLRQRLEDM